MPASAALRAPGAWRLAALALGAALLAHAAWAEAELGDAETGQRLFVAHCARCHGIDGSGGEGPPLTRVRLERAPTDERLVQVIRNGIVRSGMPGTRSIGLDGAKNVAAYVRSIGRTEEVPLPGDPELGREVYLENGCEACHIIAGEGRGIGPELTEVGMRRSLAFLREELADPGAAVPDAYRLMTATTTDGRNLRGVRIHEDEFVVVLRDADNRIWSLERKDLRSVARRMNESLMPSYTRRLDESEMTNLVSYLASLRGSNG